MAVVKGLGCLHRSTLPASIVTVTMPYEWLSQHYWTDLQEVQMFATQWMWKYNHDRPNMALGGITPKQRLAMAA